MSRFSVLRNASLRGAGVALLLSVAAFASARAEAPAACAIPSDATPAPVEPPPSSQINRATPTAAYLLALTWTPEFCRSQGHQPGNAFQCGANRFGFIVHGLWPNGAGKEHPRYCREAPALDMATLKANLCMTPSAALLQHEWAAHGTCAWNDSKTYFDKARVLREALNVPELEAKPLTAGQLRDAFLARNRGMVRKGIDVRVDKANRLTEVRICYDLKFRFAPCLSGTGTPDPIAIRITPKP